MDARAAKPDRRATDMDTRTTQPDRRAAEPYRRAANLDVRAAQPDRAAAANVDAFTAGHAHNRSGAAC